MKRGPVAQLVHDMVYNASTRHSPQQQQQLQELPQSTTMHKSIPTMTKVASVPGIEPMSDLTNTRSIPCLNSASCMNGTPKCRSHSPQHGSSGNARPRSLLSSIVMFWTSFFVWRLYTHTAGSLSNGLVWKVAWHRQSRSRLQRDLRDPTTAKRLTGHGYFSARWRPQRILAYVPDSIWTTWPWSNSAAKCFVRPDFTSTEH